MTLKRLLGKKRGATAPGLVVEPTGSRDFGPCTCCGGLTRRVWGFLRREGQAEATYFVEWTRGNVAGHGAHVDLIIGRWGEGAGRSDRFAVSLEYRQTETGPWFMVIDAGPREVSRSELVGRSMSREEVIGTPLAKQVFEMIDAIWLNDDRLDEVRVGAA